MHAWFHERLNAGVYVHAIQKLHIVIYMYVYKCMCAGRATHTDLYSVHLLCVELKDWLVGIVHINDTMRHHFHQSRVSQ